MRQEGAIASDNNQTRRDTDDWEEGASTHSLAATIPHQTPALTATQTGTTLAATVDPQPTPQATTAAATVLEQPRQPTEKDHDSTVCPEAPTRRSTRTTNPPLRYGTWGEK